MAKQKLTPISGFRFVRCFTPEHNARRFKNHIKRLGRSFKRRLASTRTKMLRRRRRA